MKKFQEQSVKSGFMAILATLLAVITCYSATVSASDKQQTLVLVGGALTTCSSMSAKNCQDTKQIAGKKANQYQLTSDALRQLKLKWPNDNASHRDQTLQILSKIARDHPEQTNEATILWAWRDLNNALLNKLTDQEYNFIIDTLEISVVNDKQKRIKEVVNTQINKESATNDILDFVSATVKVNTKKPSMLAITASSRDPYESADFYESLLDFEGVDTNWLALTPALAKAITTGQCDNLTSLREQSMNVFNRQVIYPDRINAELALCEQGVDNLVKTIESATGIMINGGDQSLARKVMFDDAGKPYPWTHAIRTRALLVGTSAGTAIQSGGKNEYGNVAMLTNGTSLSAIRDGAHALPASSERCGDKCSKDLTADSLTYHANGGLGSFDMGILDTHFSERDRTARLAILLEATKQQHGFGVDETTALVVINSADTQLMTVIGKSGVVHLNKPNSEAAFNYSYWPVGTIIDVTAKGYKVNSRTVENALPNIDIPSLPMQRFMDILTDTKLRSLTQAMCLANETQATAQQDEFSVTLSGDKDTHFYRVNSNQHGCLVDNLSIEIAKIN